MENPFIELVDELDLDAAVRRGSERNDLLPPRLEDAVLGEVGKRFSESLQTRIERGRYEPTRAEVVLVPKPGNTTRPAALLTLADRVVYDGIVEILRPRVDTALLGNEVVLWPRGITIPKRWREFEQAPLLGNSNFVAVADVTGFYETIEHECLREVLVTATGRRTAVNALMEFLGRVMGSPKGIPQGLAASDPLATAYLSPVDAAMARSCLNYTRHGDDVRIAVSSVSDARRALHAFEIELRRVGLLVNGAKAMIIPRKRYEAMLANTERVREVAREALFQARVGELEEDKEELDRVLKETDNEQLGWDHLYHGTMTFAEVIEKLQAHLLPDDMEVAIHVLRDALNKRPGTEDGLSREEFHFRVTSSLIQLSAGKSPLALDMVAEILARFPEKTEVVAGYLASQKEDAAEAVAGKVVEILSEERFRTDWETAWLLAVLGKFHNSMVARQQPLLRGIALDEGQSHYCRAEALKILGMQGELDHMVVRRLWNIAPYCFHPDLVAAAHYARGKESWCEPFLAGAMEDPINKVVVRHLERAAQQGVGQTKARGRLG
jgi:hypothetical protein